MTADRDLHISRTRYRLFAALTVVLTLAGGLAAVEWGLRALRHDIEASNHLQDGLLMRDDHLGWRVSAGWQGRHVHHDFDVRYAVNAYGFRGNFDRAFEGQRGRRIAVLGDSFVFGFGVADGETFVDHLARAAARHETVLNLGVPGYSTDQEALLAERVAIPRFRANHLVLVVYLGNDLIDNEREVPIQGPAVLKPYFQRSDGGLAVKNFPVPHDRRAPPTAGGALALVMQGGAERSSALDRWLGGLEILRRLGIVYPPPQQLFPAAAPRFRDSIELFATLAARLRVEAARRGARLDIALLPGRAFFAAAESHSAQYQDHVRREILARAQSIGAPIVDVAAAWGGAGASAAAERYYFRNDGHLTPDGHRALAALLAPALRIGQGP